MANKAHDLTGNRFEKLTVILRSPENDKYGRARWECLCDPKYGGCGNVVIVQAGNLKNGNTRSCGCLLKETVTTHGLTSSLEYNSWRGIIDRCCNEKHPAYEHYGKRGITVCDEWKESFEAFYRDMGPRPSPQHSIDRRKNDKGYSKENCRWVTPIEQQNNKRTNLYFGFAGEIKTLAQWCRVLNLSYKKTHRRIYRDGWTFEAAIEKG